MFQRNLLPLTSAQLLPIHKWSCLHSHRIPLHLCSCHWFPTLLSLISAWFTLWAWRWRQQVPVKHWYLSTKIYDTAPDGDGMEMVTLSTTITSHSIFFWNWLISILAEKIISIQEKSECLEFRLPPVMVTEPRKLFSWPVDAATLHLKHRHWSGNG